MFRFLISFAFFWLIYFVATLTGRSLPRNGCIYIGYKVNTMIFQTADDVLPTYRDKRGNTTKSTAKATTQKAKDKHTKARAAKAKSFRLCDRTLGTAVRPIASNVQLRFMLIQLRLHRMRAGER